MLATSRRAFSLIELVIVIVIIGIIGAIAIPKMSRGAAGAADGALIADLTRLRNAIDLYQTEHGGTYPALATFSDQMTLYTDDQGATATSKGGTTTTPGTAIYGPYLRAIPPLPVGANKGKTSLAASGTSSGWIYIAATGEITACSSESDSANKPYNTY